MSETAAVHDLDRTLLERIELAFPDLVGSFQVHERDLVFDGKPIADLLAYSQGRLLLISIVDGAREKSVLRALDSLAFARTQTEILKSFLPDSAEGEVLTRVVLVSPNGFSARQRERLGVLGDEQLWLLCKRELSTKCGTHTRLEALEVGEGSSSENSVDLPAWALEEPYRSFLVNIAPDCLGLSVSLVDRIRRIDPTCEWGFESESLVCRLAQEDLCQVTWNEGRLEVSSDPDSPGIQIRDMPAIDRAIDAILGEYLRWLKDDSPAESELAAVQLPPRGEEIAPGDRAEAELQAVGEADEFDELDDGGDDDLAQVELHPKTPDPLLTSEEIEAFLD